MTPASHRIRVLRRERERITTKCQFIRCEAHSKKELTYIPRTWHVTLHRSDIPAAHDRKYTIYYQALLSYSDTEHKRQN